LVNVARLFTGRVGIWQLAKKVNLSANQSEVKIDFTVPITACNLMIEYTEFYENNQVGCVENGAGAVH